MNEEASKKLRRQLRRLESQRRETADKIAEVQARLERIEQPVNYICKKGD